MPKIPVYQQQVGVAAGGLGPRANSAAFEAPGKATAAFGEQLGDVAYKLAEQERKREDRRILQEESEAAKESAMQKNMEDQSTTFGDAKNSMAAHKADYLKNLENKGYSKRRLALVKSEIDSQFSIASLDAQKNAFNRGTQLSTEADNKSLDSHRQTMRTAAPGSAPYMLAEANAAKIFDAAKTENRKLSYSPQSFTQNVKVDTFNLKLESAQTPAELDAAYQTLKGDTSLNPSVLIKAKSSVATAKSNLGTKLYESTLETVVEADMSSAEAQQLIDGFKAGEDFSITRQNGDTISFNAKEMPVGRRNQLISEAEKIKKGFQIELRSANTASIVDGYETAGRDGALAIALDVYNTTEDVEDANASVLATARTMDAQAKIALAEGNFEQAKLLSETANALVTESFGGRPSLIESADTSTSANSISKSVAATGITLVQEQQKQIKFDAGVKAFAAGELDNYAGAYTADEEEAMMNQGLSGKSLPEQLDLLSRNNMTSPTIKSIIDGAMKEGLSPSFDPSSDVNPVLQGLEAYRQVKARGEGILADHATEQNQAYFDSVLALEAVGVETVDAINRVTRGFNSGVDVDAKYSVVKSEVDGILDANVTTVFGAVLFGEKVDNRSSIQQRLEDLSKTYISMGTMDAKSAVQAAAKSINESHINLRGQLIPRRKSYPKDIKTMVDLAATDFFNKNQALPAGDKGKITDLQIDDIALIPTSGRSDEWIVIHNGVVASYAGAPLYPIGDLQGLYDADTSVQTAKKIQENLKKRGLTEPQKLQTEVQRLRREAGELTGLNLSNIRKEQGEEAAAAAIAKRKSLLEEADKLQKSGVELGRLSSGS